MNAEFSIPELLFRGYFQGVFFRNYSVNEKSLWKELQNEIRFLFLGQVVALICPSSVWKGYPLTQQLATLRTHATISMSQCDCWLTEKKRYCLGGVDFSLLILQLYTQVGYNVRHAHASCVQRPGGSVVFSKRKH